MKLTEKMDSIPEGHAVLAISPEGRSTMVLPKAGDDGLAGGHTLVIAAFANALRKHPEMVQALIVQMEADMAAQKEAANG